MEMVTARRSYQGLREQREEVGGSPAELGLAL